MRKTIQLSPLLPLRMKETKVISPLQPLRMKEEKQQFTKHPQTDVMQPFQHFFLHRFVCLQEGRAEGSMAAFG